MFSTLISPGQHLHSPKTRLALLWLVPLFSLALAETSVSAQSIGWTHNHHTVGEDVDNLAPGDSAGYDRFVQTNWNNDPVTGQATNGTSPNLLDSSGVATGASLSWLSDINNWHMSDPPVTNDGKLNHGFLAKDVTVELRDIPYSCYSLVVYYQNNQPNGQIDLTLVDTDSAQTLTIRRIASSTNFTTNDAGNTEVFGPSYYKVQYGGAVPLAPSNVTVFVGLEATNLDIEFMQVVGVIEQNTGPTAIQVVNECLVYEDGFESGGTLAWN